MLKVSVSQAPEKGKANGAIIELLSRQLGVKRSHIEIIGGQTSPQKKFLLRGIPLDEVLRRLATFFM